MNRMQRCLAVFFAFSAGVWFAAGFPCPGRALGKSKKATATHKTSAASTRRGPPRTSGPTTRRHGPKAGKSGDSETRHFTFEDMLVDGEVLKPQILYTKVMDRAKFDRLLRLRKSFLQRMLQSYRYPCLRGGW